MKSSDLAKRWAEQSHPTGRASNASFRGGFFYHYGTIIGTLAEGADGRLVALVNRRQFSSGTSKVQGELRHAAREMGLRNFTVESPLGDHAMNLSTFEAEALEAEGRIERARNPQVWRDSADDCRRRARDYRLAFGLGS